MVQVEVVYFVGAQDAFGLLRDLPVRIGGKELRRNRSIQDVLEDGGKGGAFFLGI